MPCMKSPGSRYRELKNIEGAHICERKIFPGSESAGSRTARRSRAQPIGCRVTLPKVHYVIRDTFNHEGVAKSSAQTPQLPRTLREVLQSKGVSRGYGDDRAEVTGSHTAAVSAHQSTLPRGTACKTLSRHLMSISSVCDKERSAGLCPSNVPGFAKSHDMGSQSCRAPAM